MHFRPQQQSSLLNMCSFSHILQDQDGSRTFANIKIIEIFLMCDSARHVIMQAYGEINGAWQPISLNRPVKVSQHVWRTWCRFRPTTCKFCTMNAIFCHKCNNPQHTIYLTRYFIQKNIICKACQYMQALTLLQGTVSGRPMAMHDFCMDQLDRLDKQCIVDNAT